MQPRVFQVRKASESPIFRLILSFPSSESKKVADAHIIRYNRLCVNFLSHFCNERDRRGIYMCVCVTRVYIHGNTYIYLESESWKNVRFQFRCWWGMLKVRFWGGTLLYIIYRCIIIFWGFERDVVRACGILRHTKEIVLNLGYTHILLFPTKSVFALFVWINIIFVIFLVLIKHFFYLTINNTRYIPVFKLFDILSIKYACILMCQ